MKILITILLVGTLSACHTASGLVQGAGRDLQNAGKWLEPKPSVDIKEKK